MPLSHGGPASEDALDLLKLGRVHAAVAVEVKHLEGHLEVTRRSRQHRQQEQVI